MTQLLQLSQIIFINISIMQILDYRNARYQGGTVIDKGVQYPHGVGLVLDRNYLFCIAEWQYGKINGSVFIAYPNSRIFCGRMKNNKMDGLCSFYLHDKIQIFTNYANSNRQSESYTAYLPYCKVILEVENRKEKPHINRYQQHKNSNEQFPAQTLTKFLRIKGDVNEFQSCIEFLKNHFVKKYPKKFWFKEHEQENKSKIVSFRYKQRGLGIKFSSFEKNDPISLHNGDCFLVTQTGSYVDDRLIGLGKKIVDISPFKNDEQGLFGQQGNQTVKHPRKSKSKQGEGIFLKQQKKSVFFKDQYLGCLKQFYRLQDDYSNLNVNIVEETQRIAQIIIQKQEDSVILAQIENKKQRRKTPRKTDIQNIDKSDELPKRETSLHFFEKDSQINVSAKRIKKDYFINPQTKKSIQSSVQKAKNNKISSPRKIFAQQKRTYIEIDSYDKYRQADMVHTRSKSPLNYNYLNDKSNLPINRISKRYVYQDMLQRQRNQYSPIRANYKAYQPEKSTNFKIQKFFDKPTRHEINSKINHSYAGQIVYKAPNKQRYSNFPNQQQNPPLLKRNLKDDYQKTNNTSKEDEDLIQFFNYKIGQRQNSPSFYKPNETFQNQSSSTPKNLFGHITPKRRKTPGKIVTYKKKTYNPFLQNI